MNFIQSTSDIIYGIAVHILLLTGWNKLHLYHQSQNLNLQIQLSRKQLTTTLIFVDHFQELLKSHSNQFLFDLCGMDSVRVSGLGPIPIWENTLTLLFSHYLILTTLMKLNFHKTRRIMNSSSVISLNLLEINSSLACTACQSLLFPNHIQLTFAW